jgi:MoaA/NifB/PqqE/SkfB family radical SAM enzyme
MPPLGKMVFCNLPFRRLKITETGDIKNCCFQTKYLGNIFKEDLIDIWNNSISNDIRQHIEKGTLHSNCQTEACPFMFNKTLTYFSTIEPLQTSYPTCLEIDLPSTHCNIGGINPTPETACFMCPRASRKFTKHEEITDLIIEKSKCLIPYLNALHISGIAEPFWKNKIFDILNKIGYENYKDKINILAYTNGTLFNQEIQQQYIENVKLSNLTFSLDAASEETFVKIRRIKMFKQICDNIRNYVKNKPSTHSCSVNNNLNIVNVQEAEQMVEIVADLGVKFLVLTLTVTCNGLVENTFDKIMNYENEYLFKEAEIKASAMAKKLGITLYVQRPLREKMPHEGRISLL